MSEVDSNIVFVHGAGSSADFWHMQRVSFEKAQYINLPGHGWQQAGSMLKAAIGKGRESVEGYADWLAEYIEKRGLEEVILNGHSMGGAVALELALRKPEWLRGLVLTCSGARFEASEKLMALLREDFGAAVDLIVEESFGKAEGKLTYKEKAMRHGTKRQMLRMAQEVVLGDYQATIRYDARNRLAEIDLPTLVITGEQDIVAPVTLSKELHNGIKGSRLVVVEKSGHMLPMEKAEEYNRIVAEFAGEL